MEAFIARQVDVIHLLMPMALYMRYHLRVPAKVLTWNHVNGSALTLHPEYTDLAQLSGHTLAIPSWFSIHNVLVQRLLRQADLVPVIRSEPRADQREVGLIVMAPSDMIPALANRTIAGFTVADPFNAAAALGGSGRIRRVVLSPTVMLGGARHSGGRGAVVDIHGCRVHTDRAVFVHGFAAVVGADRCGAFRYGRRACDFPGGDGGGVAYCANHGFWSTWAGPDLPAAGFHLGRHPVGDAADGASACAGTLNSGGCAPGAGYWLGHYRPGGNAWSLFRPGVRDSQRPRPPGLR